MCKENIIETTHQSNCLYHEYEDKRNMWIFYHHESNSLYILDPIFPTINSIRLIHSIKNCDIYIVLTACQKNKKQNLAQWKKIFSSISIITPDHTLIEPEHIIPSHTVKSLPNNQEIEFLTTTIADIRCLCMKINQYIFIGELTHNLVIKSVDLFPSELIKSFFMVDDKYIAQNKIITFPSFGPIALLSDLKTFQQFFNSQK